MDIRPGLTTSSVQYRFDHQIQVIDNAWIRLSDGCRLAAKIWMPVDAEQQPVSAILEYLPYRKRDGTASRDALTHVYFAGHGYVCGRVDMRGNGESEGLMWDEYLKQEHDDAVEVIDWIASQPWCDGNVGMMGISWGGFNALQVAARQPVALKAIITLCSTDDRYADDIHYKGGGLLMENLGWACTMFAYSSRPPDPALVGKRWREMWRQRLENTPLLVENWLNHPHRDEYWKHGSVCENYDAIKAAVFAVGGWGDAYSNAIPRMLDGLKAPTRGLIGPWVHKYPHIAVPQPAIGFLQESLRWWDQWLKDSDTSVMDDPLCRTYIMDSVLPRATYESRHGRWVGESSWPSLDVEQRRYYFNPGELNVSSKPEQILTVCSPQTTGTACGEFCPMWLGPDWPVDQRVDDAGSMVFDTARVEQEVEIFGAPTVELDLSADRSQAIIIVRLCDVWPSRESTRVTWGVLNLTHRDSHEHPTALQPGDRYRVRIQLDDIAYVIPSDHRIRIAISTAYWPMLWPSPETVTLSLYSGVSHLSLPVRTRKEESELAFEPPVTAPPAKDTTLRLPNHGRIVEQDMASGETTVRIIDDFGKTRLEHGLVTDEIAREVYRILPNDPLSAKADIHWTEKLSREDWSVCTETVTSMWADRGHFYINASIKAFEGESEIYTQDWDRRIPRDLV